MASLESRHSPSVRPVVLIVDGHDDTLAMYALTLSGMGFDVMTAKNAAEADQRAKDMRPDIVVTELAVHQTDQGQLLWPPASGHPQIDGVPVVVLTASVQAADRERAIQKECAALFRKPCSPQDLATRLWQVVGRHGGSVRN